MTALAGRAAAPPLPAADQVEGRHIASLLSSLERDAHVSQRQLAGELGVALGLVNSYIKRCVKKGLIKVRQAPARRYAYYLTPRGLTEKSRLTAEYLGWSLSFFRRARRECSELMADARQAGWRTLGLHGGSDLAEIAVLCATEQEIRVTVLVDAGIAKPTVLGVPVARDLTSVIVAPDGWMVTGIQDAAALHAELVAHVGPARVLTPAMLALPVSRAASLDIPLANPGGPAE